MKTRTAVSALAGSAAAGVLALLALFLSGLSRVVVVNRSGQPIAALTVRVCGQRLDFAGLDDGQSLSRWYRIRGDGGFAAGGTLADGTPVAFEGGYVTGGMFLERADLIVKKDGAVGLVEHR